MEEFFNTLDRFRYTHRAAPGRSACVFARTQKRCQD
jgi:hypothetical protein